MRKCTANEERVIKLRMTLKSRFFKVWSTSQSIISYGDLRTILHFFQTLKFKIIKFCKMHSYIDLRFSFELSSEISGFFCFCKNVFCFENCDTGGFHLYLLVFPFVYQFYSRIEALVSSSFEND